MDSRQSRVADHNPSLMASVLGWSSPFSIAPDEFVDHVTQDVEPRCGRLEMAVRFDLRASDLVAESQAGRSQLPYDAGGLRYDPLKPVQAFFGSIQAFFGLQKALVGLREVGFELGLVGFELGLVGFEPSLLVENELHRSLNIHWSPSPAKLVSLVSDRLATLSTRLCGDDTTAGTGAQAFLKSGFLMLRPKPPFPSIA